MSSFSKKSKVIKKESFTDNLINHCSTLLKRDDVKKEIKIIFKPLFEMLLQYLYPYIYLSLVFVIISFLLILGIFILILRNKIKL
jgi:hypothetical protein